jgi:DNA invertase Pin-like site-specific DNA recombinase
LIFTIFDSFVEFERELISKRKKEGLATVKEKGRIDGHKPSLSRESIGKTFAALHISKQKMPISDIGK